MLLGNGLKFRFFYDKDRSAMEVENLWRIQIDDSSAGRFAYDYIKDPTEADDIKAMICGLGELLSYDISGWTDVLAEHCMSEMGRGKLSSQWAKTS